MTRSARAKKAKKADFAKVKLKVGKRLKKAQNETRVDFKARKIILKEQLSLKSEEELLTRKKRTIKDLLSCLGSTNTYVRQDGLNGLLEIVKRNESDAFIPRLSQIITGVAPCVFDIDALIRTAALRFLEALLIKVDSSEVEPYFNVVATHLSCAMVHLNTGVQADSLRLVNILVKHTPSLIARHANTLLHNFVSLVSRKTLRRSQNGPNNNNNNNNNKSSGVCVDFNRMLHTNPSSTLNSHKGHIELLQELAGFLEVIVKEQDKVQDHLPLTLWQRVMGGSVAPVSCTTQRDNTNHSLLLSDSQQIHKFISDIIPLLFQVWAEVDPKNSDDGRQDDNNNLLDEEGVKGLSCIVSVITHITTITKLSSKQQSDQYESFISQLAAPYMSKIMPGFPYYTHATKTNFNKRNKKSVHKVDQQQQQQQQPECVLQRCHHLNLTLAHLAIQLDPQTHFHQGGAVTFMSRMLRDQTHDGEYNMGVAVNIVLHMLPQISDQQEAEGLLSSALACYQRLHPLKKDRTLLLKVLLSATHINNTTLWKCRSVEQWVNVIVEELSSMEVVGVQVQVLEVANTLRLQNNTALTDLLHRHKKTIEDNLWQKGVAGVTKSSLDRKLHTLLGET